MRNKNKIIIALTIGLVLLVGVIALSRHRVERGIDIDEGAVPLSGGIGYHASFYLGEGNNLDSGKVSWSKCKKLGNGYISEPIDGYIVISEGSDVVASGPDLSEYWNAGYDVVWDCAYGFLGKYSVIGHLTERTPEQVGEKYIPIEPDNMEPLAGEDGTLVPSVEDLKTGSFQEGQKVTTLGYYSQKDGGGASYVIKRGKVNENQGTIIVVSNGMYAELQHSGKISIKQLGAHGDGKSDDFRAFKTALTSGFDEITIPKGIYEMGGEIVNATAHVTISGESQSECIVKNGCINSQYGITLSNITFDGGVNQKISYTARAPEDGTVCLVVSPTGKQNIKYQNCTFMNVTVASFAREKNGSFGTDEITGCTFANIRRAGIFHSLNIDDAKYTKNSFANIGGNDILRGYVCAMVIGDISNSINSEAKKVLIEDNTFSNLFTKDDFSGDEHIINANFIAVRGDKGIIHHNVFSNLMGYGDDREGIYTKVRELTVSDNNMSNCGLGEGYICAKPHEGDSYYTIIGNTISGSAGCAIRSYAPATISGNTISIDNCMSVITNTMRSDNPTSKSLVIKDNIVNCGTYSELNVNGTTISSYNTGKAIRISNVTVPIVIEGNKLYPSTSFGQYFAVGNPGKSVSICGNAINGPDKDGTGVYVFSNKDGAKLSHDCEITIDGNQFDMSIKAKVARVKFEQDDSLVSSRNISFSGNIVNFSGGTGNQTVLICDSGQNNQDRLVTEGNECNLSLEKTYITYSVNSVETNDSEFATYLRK